MNINCEINSMKHKEWKGIKRKEVKRTTRKIRRVFSEWDAQRSPLVCVLNPNSWDELSGIESNELNWEERAKWLESKWTSEDEYDTLALRLIAALIRPNAYLLLHWRTLSLIVENSCTVLCNITFKWSISLSVKISAKK